MERGNKYAPEDGLRKTCETQLEKFRPECNLADMYGQPDITLEQGRRYTVIAYTYVYKGRGSKLKVPGATTVYSVFMWRPDCGFSVLAYTLWDYVQAVVCALTKVEGNEIYAEALGMVTQNYWQIQDARREAARQRQGS